VIKTQVMGWSPEKPHVKLPDSYDDYNRILRERQLKKKIDSLEEKINSLEIRLKELENKCQD
jgi:polyhydroxyalkanoate synthesis regulator phasin